MGNSQIIKGACVALAGVVVWCSLSAGVCAANFSGKTREERALAMTLLLTQFAKQTELYGEDEGEGESGEGEGESTEGAGEFTEGEGEGEDADKNPLPCFLNKPPWREYAAFGGVVALAFGILWLAEEPPSPCMIATAAYGVPTSGKLTLLRIFRDRMLLNSSVGTACVDIYYRGGVPLADFVASHGWAARLVRILLAPVLVLVAAALFFPEALALAAGAGLLLPGTLIVIYWMTRSRGYRLFAAQKNR